MDLRHWDRAGKVLLSTFCVAFVVVIVLGRTVFRNETDYLFEQFLSAHPIVIPGIMILTFAFTALVDLRKALNGQIAYYFWLPIVLVAMGYSTYLFVQGIKNAL